MSSAHPVQVSATKVDAQNHQAMLRIDAQAWEITVGNGSKQR